MAITGAPRTYGGTGAGGGVGKADLGDPWVNDPITGKPIRQSELTRRNASQVMDQQTAEARGELYIADPYGVRSGTGAGGGGGYGGGGGDYGSTGSFPSAGSPAGNLVVNSPGAGGGNINLSRGTYEDQQNILLQDKLAREKEQRALSALSSYGSGGDGGSRVSYDTAGSEAARAAAFARAKEQAGQNAAAAMRTLQDVASRRGIRGSTIEGGMIGDIVGGGRGEVADFTREQLIQDLNSIQHIADTTYQGNITQRGQDQGARQAYLSILSGLY